MVFRLLLMAVALLLVSCTGDGDDPAAKNGKRQPIPLLVEAATVQSETVSRTWQRIGTLVHRHVLHVYNQEEGRIKDLPWYEGDQVSKGDALLRLDDRLLRAELKKARATRSMAARKVARLERLRKTNAASEENLIAAQTELELARAEVEILETRLGYTLVKAPFDGIITERLAEPGDVKPRNSHLLTLADPASLLVRVEASEQLIADISKGGRAQVILDLPYVEPLAGRVWRIYPTLNPLTRQGKVEIRLERIPPQAQAGQYARVELTGNEKQRLLIPFSALRRDRMGEYVYIIERNHALRRDVRSGSRFGSRIEILDGLKGGERIIKRGFMNLKDDTLITVLEQT